MNEECKIQNSKEFHFWLPSTSLSYQRVLSKLTERSRSEAYSPILIHNFLSA